MYDYINRDAVFDWFCESADIDGCVDLPKNNGSCKKGCRYCIDGKELDEIPTADVVERKELDKITEAHEKIGYGKGFRDGYAQAMEEAIKAVGINTWAGSRITQLQPAKFRERREDETV